MGNITSFFFPNCFFLQLVSDKFHDALKKYSWITRFYHVLNTFYYPLNMTNTQKIEIQKWHLLFSLFFSEENKRIKKENIKPSVELKAGWVCVCVSCSVVSESLQPHRLQPTRRLCPWASPGRNTGVGHHFLLQKKLQKERKWSHSVVFNS